VPDCLTAGVSLKPQHYAEALAATADGLWFEVHPENYMDEGGQAADVLGQVAARHPVSLHGVALSLAADAAPDLDHLRRLRRLADRIEPVLMSEHLAWSMWRGAYHPDLLPFPRTLAALDRIADNIARSQDALGRTIAIENPTHYLRLDGHELDELEFLTRLCERTGCGLLMDVNNVHISASNLGFSAVAYIDAVPGELVREVHLAGHRPDPEHGEALLIDSHDAPVAESVWVLYERLLARIGPVPTLLERDGEIPPFAELLAERDRAHTAIMHHAPKRLAA